jgi:hypothetical protein
VSREHPIHCLRQPDREALQAADERIAAVRLEEQVHVIVLDAEVEDAESHVGNRSRRRDGVTE